MVGEPLTTTTPSQLAGEKHMVGMLLVDDEPTVVYGFWSRTKRGGV